MDFDPSKNRWRVRWRENGKQRSRRFVSDSDALAFEEARAPPQTNQPAAPPARAEGHAIYVYATKAGPRYRFVFRQSDGSLSSRRGFVSRRAAATARRKLIESIDRGEVIVYREDFETFWDRLVVEKRAYMTRGAHLDLAAHGRKRLVPFFGADPLSSIDSERVREWLAEMTELVEAGELAPKTVNNARTSALPLERLEIDFLRLAMALWLDQGRPAGAAQASRYGSISAKMWLGFVVRAGA